MGFAFQNMETVPAGSRSLFKTSASILLKSNWLIRFSYHGLPVDDKEMALLIILSEEKIRRLTR